MKRQQLQKGNRYDDRHRRPYEYLRQESGGAAEPAEESPTTNGFSTRSTTPDSVGDNDESSSQYADDDKDTYVSANYQQRNNGPASFVAAAMATTAAVKVAGAVLDEDDLFASVGALVNALGSGGGGGGGMPAAQAAALQQMAVGATQSATASVASGSSAAASGGGGILGAAANNAGPATTVVAATAAAAGLYAGFMNGAGELPLCPNIANPDIVSGSVSFDFLGAAVSARPNVTESIVTTLVERYNDMFGCDSMWARTMINCSCTGSSCCDAFEDPVFGDIVRCTFECYVHCAGCPFEEPMFLQPPPHDDGILLSPTTLTAAGQWQVDSTRSCSPLCRIGKELEFLICDDDCRMIRSTAHTNNVSPNVNSNSADDAPSVEVSSDDQVAGISQTFIPLPTKMPTLAPSSSDDPSGLPTALPSLFQSADPTVHPSILPSIQTSYRPTSPFIFEATFHDEFGFSYGSVDGAVVSASNVVRGSLTVRANVPLYVRAVAFYFDWIRVYDDHHRPFYMFGENENGFGATYPPLLNVGLHTVMLVAYAEDLTEIGVRTVYFQTVE